MEGNPRQWTVKVEGCGGEPKAMDSEGRGVGGETQ